MAAKKKKIEVGEEVVEKTVVTSIEKVAVPKDERAYIIFLSGPLKGKMYHLEDERTVIGRGEDVDIYISDLRISRHHLVISVEGGESVIEDLGSTNGTFVNGQRVKSRTLRSGDKIHISSDTLFRFAVGDEVDRMYEEEIHQMANYDAVTGIYNKHVFGRRLKEEFSYAKRSRQPLSLLMIDIDFFKKVNDTFGHMTGDYVLLGVAQRIAKTVRDEDILARYGGEEFGVIMRSADAKGATGLAERVRKVIAADPFKFEKHSIPITVSIGVATLAGDNFETPDELVERSDACLYKSKESGRNRVTA